MSYLYLDTRKNTKRKALFCWFSAHEVLFQCSIKDRNQLENPLFLIANGKVCFNSSAVGKMYEFNVEGNGSIKSVQAGTFTWHLVIKIMCESLILSGYVSFDQRLQPTHTQW